MKAPLVQESGEEYSSGGSNKKLLPSKVPENFLRVGRLVAVQGDIEEFV